MVQLDIWGNITLYKQDNELYKQIFFEDGLLKYEDNLGNYWTKEFGDFPFLKLKYVHKESFFNLILEAHQKDDILEVSYNTIRGLRTYWSGDMWQDVDVDIGAEAELTAMLSEQIAIEIDREMMNRVFNIEPLIL